MSKDEALSAFSSELFVLTAQNDSKLLLLLSRFCRVRLCVIP